MKRTDDRLSRTIALVALTAALLALVLAWLAWRRADDRAAEFERLREAIERATDRAPGDGRPPLPLDPGIE